MLEMRVFRALAMCFTYVMCCLSYVLFTLSKTEENIRSSWGDVKLATRKQIYGTILHDPFFDHLSRYLGLGYCVFMANYYNSVRPIPTKKNLTLWKNWKQREGQENWKSNKNHLEKGEKEVTYCPSLTSHCLSHLWRQHPHILQSA